MHLAMNRSRKGMTNELKFDGTQPQTSWCRTWTRRTVRLCPSSSQCSLLLPPIGAGNYWTVDEAGRSTPYDNWSEGQLVWRIPIGWKRMMYDGDDYPFADKPDYALYKGQGSRPLLIGNSEDAYTQIFTISPYGKSSVQKFGYRLTRSRWRTSGKVIKIQ